MDLQYFENRALARGFVTIAGIDEAGRGPLAGPVVAAAVILPAGGAIEGVTDSKLLTARQRERFYDAIYERAVSIGVAIVDAGEIDRINILQASRLAMKMAAANLRPPADCLLIDGNTGIELDVFQRAIPKGDRRSASIAAASVVAKVSRDRLMQQYHRHYPQYGFDRHKGYPTRAHREAICRFGCCPIHRRTFRGVREHLGRGSSGAWSW